MIFSKSIELIVSFSKSDNIFQRSILMVFLELPDMFDEKKLLLSEQLQFWTLPTLALLSWVPCVQLDINFAICPDGDRIWSPSDPGTLLLIIILFISVIIGSPAPLLCQAISKKSPITHGLREGEARRRDLQIDNRGCL